MEKALDRIFNLFDRIKGDKVIWIAFILLVCFSFVAIFSSTSLKVASEDVSRFNVFWGQFVVDMIGIAAVIIIYFIPVGIIRFFSQFGFILSFAMLVILLLSGNLREINIGFPLQPYEFTKVFMILYLSWATQAFKEGKFRLLNVLSKNFKYLEFLGRETVQLWLMIFGPIVIVTACIIRGGFSSAMVTLVASTFTVGFGKVPIKRIFQFFLVICGLILLTYGAWKVTHASFLGSRWATVEGRIVNKYFRSDKTVEFQTAYEKAQERDYNRQKEGAKIAVKEGGPLGKGIGKSTQRYAVADMYGDYMFCFILEEYGLWGCLLLLIIYASLFARGATIAQFCEQPFSKTAISGCLFLISGQAFLHMMVNVDIFPLTGQTLPLVSYGKSAFIAFCIAFGVVLSISKTVENQQLRAILESEEESIEEQ